MSQSATAGHPSPTQGVAEAITDWFHTNSRPLPWREPTTTTWAVFISEVMSQQTPVERLIPAWRRWLQRWPTPAALAAAERAQVIREWGTLGYPRRALWLQEAAQIICDTHGGEVPARYEDLLALPGVGDYTASAVCAFAFGQSIPVLDTNVRRVLARIFAGTQIASSSSPTKAERALAEQLLPASDPATWSVAVMEFGSLVCRARQPNCGNCVVASECQWRMRGYPASDAPTRRQRFEGTDRQVRGKVLRLLREATGPVPAGQVTRVWPDTGQLQRCIDSLINDGLIEPADGDGYQLPSAP